jgi:hypothetical protein
LQSPGRQSQANGPHRSRIEELAQSVDQAIAVCAHQADGRSQRIKTALHMTAFPRSWQARPLYTHLHRHALIGIDDSFSMKIGQ